MVLQDRAGETEITAHVIMDTYGETIDNFFFFLLLELLGVRVKRSEMNIALSFHLVWEPLSLKYIIVSWLTDNGRSITINACVIFSHVSIQYS